MKRQYLPVYALALAIAFVGALWLGVQISTLLLLGIVLVCPVMMFFMMRGGHGGHGDHHGASRDDHDRRTPSHH